MEHPCFPVVPSLFSPTDVPGDLNRLSTPPLAPLSVASRRRRPAAPLGGAPWTLPRYGPTSPPLTGRPASTPPPPSRRWTAATGAGRGRAAPAREERPEWVGSCAAWRRPSGSDRRRRSRSDRGEKWGGGAQGSDRGGGTTWRGQACRPPLFPTQLGGASHQRGELLISDGDTQPYNIQ